MGFLEPEPWNQNPRNLRNPRNLWNPSDPWHFPCSQHAAGGTMYRERGAIGYILLWLMGVPAGVLFLIFLLRGCN
jgi:hypothetical protein